MNSRFRAFGRGRLKFKHPSITREMNRVMGRAIAVARVYGLTPGSDGFDLALQGADPSQLWCGQLPDGAFVLAAEVGTGVDGASPVDPQRVLAFLRDLLRTLKPHAQLSAYLHAGLGALTRFGPIGLAVDELLSVQTHPPAGRVAASREATAAMSPVGRQGLTGEVGPCWIANGQLHALAAAHPVTPYSTPVATMTTLRDLQSVDVKVQQAAGASEIWSPPGVVRVGRAYTHALLGSRAALVPPPQSRCSWARSPRSGHRDSTVVRGGDTLCVDMPPRAGTYQWLVRVFVPSGVGGTGPFPAQVEVLNHCLGVGTTEELPLQTHYMKLKEEAGTEWLLSMSADGPVPSLQALLDQVNSWDPDNLERSLYDLLDAVVLAHPELNLAALVDVSIPHDSSPAFAIKTRWSQIEGLMKADKYADVVQVSSGLLDPDMEPSPDLCQLLLVRGLALRRLRRLDEATRVFSRAFTVADALQLRGYQGDARRHLGVIAMMKGNVKEADVALMSAIRIHQEAGQELALGKDYLERAQLLMAEGKYEAARSDGEKALELARRVGARELEANAVQLRGKIRYDQSELELAQQDFERALQISRELNDARGQCRALQDLAQLALDLGDLSHSEELCRQQAELNHSYTDTEIAAALTLRANVLVRMGRFAAAGRQLERVNRYPQDVLAPYMAAIRLSQAAFELDRGDAAKARMLMDLIDVEDPDVIERQELAWRVHLMNIKVDAALGQSDLAERYEQALGDLERRRMQVARRERASFFETRSELIDGWIRQLISEERPAREIFSAVDRLKGRIVSDALIEAHSAAQVQVPPWERAPGDVPPLNDLETLPPWLSFYVLGDVVHVLAAHQGNVSRLELPVEEGLGVGEWAQRLEEGIRDPATTRSRWAAIFGHGWAALGAWLERLPSDSPVAISPHGVLFGVPLHAMPLPGGQLLVERLAPFYVPSVEVWRLGRTPGPRGPGGVVALTPGDGANFISEVETVLRVLGGGRYLPGESATPSAVKAVAGEARVLHITAHGVQASEDGREPSHIKLVREPQHPDPHFQLGRLTASELSMWPLKADLVALMCCETNSGRVRAGTEAPYHLSWAALQAGARAVMSCAWRVPDSATFRLVTAFYEHYARGASPEWALAQAQRNFGFGGGSEEALMLKDWAGVSIWRVAE